jgi:alkylhydroperoxidase family enzyme
MNGLLTHALLSMACGVLGAAAVHAVVPSAELQRIATVDIGGLVRTRIDVLREAGTEPEEVQRAARVWGQQLAAATQALAIEQDLVILVAPSVVAGASDVTATVAQRLDKGVP